MQSGSDHQVIGQGDLQIGRNSTVTGATFIFQKPGTITIGDYCHIGPGTRFVVSGGDVTIGDWTSIHNESLVLSEAGLSIGQHCWFGQNSILDGTGGLYIGNGVRVGMYSQLWTHVAAGEQIEGCTLIGTAPTHIEDDVWLVGSCICASGVTIGRRAVALIGSNITKSIPAHSVIAGIPAQPKQGLSFYKDIDMAEKWSLLTCWLSDYAQDLDVTVDDTTPARITLSKEDGQTVTVFQYSADAAAHTATSDTETIVCLETKTYQKRFTDLEFRVLKYLSSNKARFYSKATQ